MAVPGSIVADSGKESRELKILEKTASSGIGNRRSEKLFSGESLGEDGDRYYPVHDDNNYLSGSFQCVRHLSLV